MPITLHPSAQPLTSITRHKYGDPAKDALNLLKLSCGPLVFNKCGEIFQSSVAANSSKSSLSERFAWTDLSTQTVHPADNGFVKAAVKAYSNHQALVIRPDDVWIAILAQLNLYVNANAEELRDHFVNHQGQKELEVEAVGTRYTVDFGALAQQMGDLIQENVNDPTLKDWIIPDFSTTTPNDHIVASVVMMATVQKYFSFKMKLRCGLPSVTLLGEKEDWQKLVTRVERLPSFGAQTEHWFRLLYPVLTRFVTSFEDPESQATKDFWQTIAHRTGGGSGPSYLSGWITAFCYFGDKGVPLYTEKAVEPKTYMRRPLGEFQLDGVAYHRVDMDDIPPAYVEVDVKLDDNGTMFQTTMVAGLVGIHVSDSGKETETHPGKDDTVQPVAGWWIFRTKDAIQDDSSWPFYS